MRGASARGAPRAQAGRPPCAMTAAKTHSVPFSLPSFAPPSPPRLARYAVLEGPGFQLFGAVLFVVSGTVLALGFGAEIYALCVAKPAPAAASAAAATAAPPAAAGAAAPAMPEPAKPATTGESKEGEPTNAAAASAPAGA